MKHLVSRILNKGEASVNPLCGFTLIEVMVSVSIFSMVMLVATGAVFSIVQANKRTHSIKSVMTNLNFALESMTRDIRLGFRYSCDGAGDCSPGSVFQFKANRDVDGGGYNPTDNNDQVEYSLVSNRIQKRIVGMTPYFITSPEISVSSLRFYVIGTASSPGDYRQPKVVMVIQGMAGAGTSQSNFNIQTTLTQRPIDS